MGPFENLLYMHVNIGFYPSDPPGASLSPALRSRSIVAFRSISGTQLVKYSKRQLLSSFVQKITITSSWTLFLGNHGAYGNNLADIRRGRSAFFFIIHQLFRSSIIQQDLSLETTCTFVTVQNISSKTCQSAHQLNSENLISTHPLYNPEVI